jgi:replicative DNA helicase
MQTKLNVEKIILKNLLRNDEYTRKVLPFLKSEYFKVESERELFSLIHSFIVKYNSFSKHRLFENFN